MAWSVNVPSPTMATIPHIQPTKLASEFVLLTFGKHPLIGAGEGEAISLFPHMSQPSANNPQCIHFPSMVLVGEKS